MRPAQPDEASSHTGKSCSAVQGLQFWKGPGISTAGVLEVFLPLLGYFSPSSVPELGEVLGTALALLFLSSSNWRSEKWSKGKQGNPIIVSLEQHPDHVLSPAVLCPGFSSCCEPSESLQPQTTPANGIKQGFTNQPCLFILSPELCPRILEGMSTSGLGEALEAASCPPKSLGLIQQ